jgi:hypothetical protein
MAMNQAQTPFLTDPNAADDPADTPSNTNSERHDQRTAVDRKAQP